MKLKQFFTDDDAVSPVIGVILMVAITVILAAVIASFVLGLGQSTGDTAPSITFSDDFDDGSLTISVSNVGDTVEAGDLYLRGTTGSNPIDEDFANSGSTGAFSKALGDTSSELVAGQSIKLSATSSYDIDIIYDPGDGDSSTLTTVTGPDA